MPMPKAYEQGKKGEVADAKAVPAKNDKENKKGGREERQEVETLRQEEILDPVIAECELFTSKVASFRD
eukprot:1194424-Prorocentrum_minimum.AAC.3